MKTAKLKEFRIDECGLFGYDTMEPGRWVLTFRSSILHLSSEHDVYVLLIWTKYVPPSRWYQTALCYKSENHNIILRRYEYLGSLIGYKNFEGFGSLHAPESKRGQDSYIFVILSSWNQAPKPSFTNPFEVLDYVTTPSQQQKRQSIACQDYCE
jgi:hypothetical protein